MEDQILEKYNKYRKVSKKNPTTYESYIVKHFSSLLLSVKCCVSKHTLSDLQTSKWYFSN